jgi:hypothetical protein
VIDQATAINIPKGEVQALFHCPNDDCHNFFIVYYRLNPQQQMEIYSMKPSKVEHESFPEAIRKISPSFVSIYEQALESRALGLDQIAGPGFRKAFEFLVKDYAKTLSKADKHKDIETSFAGNVVKNFIPDPRIQKVASRALWLGNDETHYLRKWEDHDIQDLITLIRLTINWIDIEQLSEKYTKELPEESTGAGS